MGVRQDDGTAHGGRLPQMSRCGRWSCGPPLRTARNAADAVTARHAHGLRGARASFQFSKR